MSKRDDKNDPTQMSRRQFLGQASCAAVGATGVFSTLTHMTMANNALSGLTFPDYKALVCVFFGGGMDSFNMLVPRGADEWADYAATRADLALARDTLLPVNPVTPIGRELGLHPGMPELQTLFDAGDAAFVANVGTLVEPTTLDQYRSRSVNLPLGLFSHSDQQNHWQTSLPDERTAVGWAGRMADLLVGVNQNEAISMNISLSGTNVFQAGSRTVQYDVGPNGSTNVRDYESTALDAIRRRVVLDSGLDIEYDNLLQRAYASKTRASIDAHINFAEAIDTVGEPTALFPESRLADRLSMIARTIAARELLGMSRQIFFVSMGGWDHHDEVIVNQENMLPVVSQSIAAFHEEMTNLGLGDQVTLFTGSDFGRTLTSNGRGSDHAWGGNHVVVGGAVNGGEVYGEYPDLFRGNPLDTGRGRLIPTMSVDELFAELVRWFGVPDTDLGLILPNLDRFWAPDGVNGPLGLFTL